MKILKTIKAVLSDGNEGVVFFGHPSTNEELNEMYKFRNDMYAAEGYIDKDYYPDGLDRDFYDRTGKCVYFVAKNSKKIIGTARLIKDEYLPTEKECFDFSEPEEIKTIPRERRAEVGRLIIEKYDDDVYFPRHLVMIGLIDEISKFAFENKIEGGYGFIKDSLKKKMERINIPVKFIKNFKTKYDQKLLYNYFNDPDDPVWPVYYLTKDIVSYSNMIFNVYLKKIGENQYKMTRNFFKKWFLYLRLKI